MDGKPIITGLDFCSKACTKTVFRRARMFISPKVLSAAVRPDGTVRIMGRMEPGVTEKELDEAGGLARPVGVSCPVCGELLPSGGGVSFTT